VSEKDDALSALDEQARRGSLFALAVARSQIDRANQTEAAVYGLIDLLIGNGTLSPDEVVASIEKTGREMREAGRHQVLEVVVRGDDPIPETSAEEIDCAARIPYCKAACCQMRWPLALEEVESGPVKWDLGRPFFNLQSANGYCHCFEPGQGCSIYDQRPAPCREYTCAEDERIWLDFENMVPNTDWIDGHHEEGPVEMFLRRSP
jgi:hypothetical protein